MSSAYSRTWEKYSPSYLPWVPEPISLLLYSMSASNDNPILSDPSLLTLQLCPFFLFLSSTFPVSICPPDRIVLMMILPGPALLGEKLNLRCVVLGTDRISRTIFYKDKQTIKDSSSSSYVIDNVTESDQGKYSCQATYTRSDKGKPNTVNSTQQELIVSAPPMKAVLSESAGLSCSCSSCPNGAFYHWYYKQPDHQWLSKGTHKSYTDVMSAGSYACRAVWKNGRSALSNIHYCEFQTNERT